MTMKIGFLIAFIYLSAATAAPAASDEIVIECEYDSESVPKIIGCMAKITSPLSAPNGTPVKIIPLDETQRQKVTLFELDMYDISNHFDNILKAVATSFPNLRFLIFNNASISHVSKDHLKLFPALEGLDLGYNKITVLESDLFENSPKMKLINFESNMISKVDDKFLNSFDLVAALFSSNPCEKQSTCESMINKEKLKNEFPLLYTAVAIKEAEEDLGALVVLFAIFKVISETS